MILIRMTTSPTRVNQKAAHALRNSVGNFSDAVPTSVIILIIQDEIRNTVSVCHNQFPL